MTLIELTVIILVLISLIGILFIGANSWKNGSDRAMCIMNQYHVQEAVRSFANMNGLEFGEDTSALNPPVDLETALITSGFFDSYPECPADGVYTRGGNTIPPVGELYMTCSLSDSRKHEPKEMDSW